ncbi:hypothetical protein ATK36_2164 [Amycolatopsis sulphurea]|uniref:Uncharacterized protein n=1 Tax=Amycolatopsis sulphurea TaxID=76022 RepID=A0A2A9F853_9PSEU|nr:hypothetical protein [Amycolatopsis sulphurea]PFG47143.1 hypothetical protein ATK36_2164 [Amycolatopsis sulphurea]
MNPEILKLARALDVEPARLAYLAEVDQSDVRRFREQVTTTLFDANRVALERMALASRLLPAPVLARIAEKVFGPLLCARIAGLVDVSRGIDVAKRLSPRFLASVAAELDPRRATAIITRIPLPTVLAVARELAAREDWITLGRFVGHLPDDTVRRSIGLLDSAGLLHTAYVLDDKTRVDHVLSLLPGDQLPKLVRAAAIDESLWEPAVDLLAHLKEARRAAVRPLLDELPEELRRRVQATIE